MHPAFVISESLFIPAYFLMISLGALVGLVWFFKRAGEDEEHIAWSIAAVGMVAGFVGARLLHVFFEAPDLYQEHPRAAFEIWRGGFVFYGGLIAAFAVVRIYTQIQKIYLDPWLDKAALPLSLAYIVGRFGCFLNGCCYGKYCELPWAMSFHSHGNWGLFVSPRHPTQLYAMIWESIFLLILWVLERKGYFRRAGLLFWTWICTHSVGRVLMEYYRDDDRGPAIAGMSISIWISLALLTWGMFQVMPRMVRNATGDS